MVTATRPRTGARTSTGPGPVRATVAGLGVVAVPLASVLVLARPVAAVVALGAVLFGAAFVMRLEWAVLAYVAIEPFGDLVGSVHPAAVKGFGVLLFVAWLVRVVLDRRPVAVRHAATTAAGLFALALLGSIAWHPHGGSGLEVLGRYASYLAVMLVLIDAMRTIVPPRRVALTFLASASASAVVGLGWFLVDGGRAAGPLEDANDFAFYLVCALPFALLLWREGGRTRGLGLVAVLLLTVTILATFSRGALLGSVAVIAVATVLGLVRGRQLAAAALVVAMGAAGVVVVATDVVERSLHEKQYVAADNVDSRFASWTMAAEMTADHPLLGTGPGGFRAEFDAYADDMTADATHLDVAHQMYLDVASETGLIGVSAFLAILAAGIRGAWRGRHGADRRLAAAVCAAFAGTLLAAMFLTEQYYLPIWLLVALGAALDPRPTRSPQGA